MNFIAFVLYIMATGLTVMYTMRLIFYRLRRGYNLESLNNVRDEDTIITGSIVFLGLGAIFGGAALSWVMFPEPYIVCIRGFMKGLVLLIRFSGGRIGYILTSVNAAYRLGSLRSYKFTIIAGSMWFIPFLSSSKNRELSLFRGEVLQKVGDKG